MRRVLLTLSLSIALAILTASAAIADGIPSPWAPVGP